MKSLKYMKFGFTCLKFFSKVLYYQCFYSSMRDNKWWNDFIYHDWISRNSFLFGFGGNGTHHTSKHFKIQLKIHFSFINFLLDKFIPPYDPPSSSNSTPSSPPNVSSNSPLNSPLSEQSSEQSSAQSSEQSFYCIPPLPSPIKWL